MSKSITVQTDAPGAENFRLTVSFNAVTPILAVPAFRMYFNAVEGSSLTERVLLRRADGQPLEARVIGTTLERGLQVELAPAQGSEPAIGKLTPQRGDQWLVGTMESAVAGSHDGLITVATNDPRAPKVEVPLVVRIRATIEARPSSVRLWPADGGPGGASLLVRLAHAGRSAFAVTGIEVADPTLVAAKLESSGSQQIHSIRFTLAEGVTVKGGTLRTTVRIATSDPARPLIEVPVEVIARHEAARRPVQPTPASGVVAAPPSDGG